MNVHKQVEHVCARYSLKNAGSNCSDTRNLFHLYTRRGGRGGGICFEVGGKYREVAWVAVGGRRVLVPTWVNGIGSEANDASSSAAYAAGEHMGAGALPAHRHNKDNFTGRQQHVFARAVLHSGNFGSCRRQGVRSTLR